MLLTAAATITWTGGSATGANWSDPANWDLHRAPVNGDSLVFPASAQQFANNDDLTGLSVNSITFQGMFATSGGYTLSGDDLSVGAAGIVDNSSVNGATATLANQLDLNVVLAAAQFWRTDDIYSYGQHQLTINGNVANNGFGLTAKGTGTIDIAGEITGSGSLSVVGVPAGVLAGQPTGGTFGGLALDLSHTNTYTGGTFIYASASVSVSVDGALGPGGTNDAGTTVAQGAILFNAVAYSTPEAIAINGGTLSGSGDASFSGPVTVTGSLTLAGNNTTTTLAGDIGGSGTLTKVGIGTFDLTATNDFTGTTDVNAGTLLVDGSTAAGNAFHVGPAFATLGGTGTVAGTITLEYGAGPASGVNLSPGTGPDPEKDTGTLKNSAGVTFGETNPAMQSGPPDFSVQLGGTSASPTNDQLDSAGSVSLGNAFLDLHVLPGAGPFDAGQQFVIVQAGAPISGTFNGLPEGSTVSDGTQSFTISYANNRVTLTALPVGAATITWTGNSTTSGNWSDPSNWDLGRAPGNGDTLVFPATASRLANNDDIPGLSVTSIKFGGTFAPAAGGYHFGGDDLTLGAGGINDGAVGGPSGTAIAGLTNEIDLNLKLSAAQTWSNNGTPSFPLVINGNVANGGSTLTVTGYGVIDVGGEISGSGGLGVGGNGAASALVVNLRSANTYTGATDVEYGTLIVDGSTAAASTVTVDPGATLGGTGAVGGTIFVLPSVDHLGMTLAPGGTINPGASRDPSLYTGTLSNAGGVAFGSGPPGGPIVVGFGRSGPAVFAVQLGGTAVSPTNDQLDSAGTITLELATLDLSSLPGAGPFDAGQQFVIVQAGAPIAGTFNGLPEGSTVSDGTQSFTISYANNRVTLTALPVGAATITWTGKSTTSSNWSDPANWDLSRAPVSGDSLVFPGSAQQLANNDDIAGLSVNSIMFQGVFDPVPGGYHIGGDALTLGAGGITDDGTPGSTIVGVVNQFNLNLNLDAAQIWSISDSSNRHDLFLNGNVNNAGFELSLSIIGQDFIYLTGQISGSGGLSITGLTPTVELQGVNTYTGVTDVENGTLIVDGSTDAASTVQVGAATLGGTGTIGGTIRAVGGNISPGAGPDPSSHTGILTTTGDVALAGVNPPPGELYASRAAVFVVQLGGTASAPTNDQLNSTATVSFHLATLDLTTLAGTGAFNAGQQFIIAQAGAPIEGTFNGLSEGSIISDAIQNFTISYANDRVTLTAQPISVTTSSYLNGQTGDGTADTFVHNLYRELLGREPDAAGQAYWVSVYNQGPVTGSSVPGAPTAQQIIVADFLTSAEYHQHVVEGIYTNFLHRMPDTGGLAFWTAEIAGGTDEKSVLAHILSSDEYFDRAEGPGVHVADLTIQAQAQAWVSALYHDILGRTADAGGLAYWTQQATGLGQVGRTMIALEFLSRPEADQKLLNGNYPGTAGSVSAPGTLADGAYALAEITGNGWDYLYFQGNLSAAEVDTLFAQFQAGESYEQMIAGMLDMSQYFG